MVIVLTLVVLIFTSGVKIDFFVKIGLVGLIRVTPVTGMIPTTTIRFKRAWMIIPKESPKERYLANR